MGAEKLNKSWKEIPIGGRIEEPGSAKNYKTGGWRTYRPVWNKEKCINCLQCWMYCPDSVIRTEDGKITGFNLDHCKGCGICASVCPVKCIEMKQEGKDTDKENIKEQAKK